MTGANLLPHSWHMWDQQLNEFPISSCISIRESTYCPHDPSFTSFTWIIFLNVFCSSQILKLSCLCCMSTPSHARSSPLCLVLSQCSSTYDPVSSIHSSVWVPCQAQHFSFLDLSFDQQMSLTEVFYYICGIRFHRLYSHLFSSAFLYLLAPLALSFYPHWCLGFYTLSSLLFLPPLRSLRYLWWLLIAYNSY